jgi:hypothetical protein
MRLVEVLRLPWLVLPQLPQLKLRIGSQTQARGSHGQTVVSNQATYGSRVDELLIGCATGLELLNYFGLIHYGDSPIHYSGVCAPSHVLVIIAQVRHEALSNKLPQGGLQQGDKSALSSSTWAYEVWRPLQVKELEDHPAHGAKEVPPLSRKWNELT